MPTVSLTISELTTINPKLMQAITETWRVGSVLEATVSQQGHKSISLKLEQGVVKLPLNPEQSYSKLSPNQKVWLNIEQLIPQLRIAISQSPPTINLTKTFPVRGQLDIAPMPLNPTSPIKMNEVPVRNLPASTAPTTPLAPLTPPTPLNALKQQLSLALQASAPKLNILSPDTTSTSKNIQETLSAPPLANRPNVGKPEWNNAELTLPKLTPLPSELTKASIALTNYSAKLGAQTAGSPSIWLARTINDWPIRYLAMRHQVERALTEMPQGKDAPEVTQVDPSKIPNQEKLHQLLHQLTLTLPTPRQLRQTDVAESLLKHVLLARPQTSGAGTTSTTSSSAPTLSSGLAQLLFFLTPLMSTPSALSTALDSLPLTLMKPELVKDTAQQTNTPAGAEAFANDGDENSDWVKTIADDIARLLGRQQINWLNNARTDSQSLGLYAELPLSFKQSIDTVEILVREDPDGQRAPSEHSNYVIRLRFELGPLGPVQFLLSLNDDEIAIQFYAEQPNAIALFNDFSDLLTQDLESEGIRVAETSAHQIPSIPGIRPPYAEGFHERV